MKTRPENVEPYTPPKDWICLNLRDADGQPAAGYTYRVRDSSGEERMGKLDKAGEIRVAALAGAKLRSASKATWA
jgi:hypothetical protein